MNSITMRRLIVGLLFITPGLAFAQATVSSLIKSLTGAVLLFVPILLGLAVLTFFWGLVKFINQAGDEKAVEEGKGLMVWGMVAIFVMVALWGILGWLQHITGLDQSVNLGNLPSQPDNIP